jgi:hypothetical protein
MPVVARLKEGLSITFSKGDIYGQEGMSSLTSRSYNDQERADLCDLINAARQRLNAKRGSVTLRLLRLTRVLCMSELVELCFIERHMQHSARSHRTI